jgi:hypothetical protein
MHEHRHGNEATARGWASVSWGEAASATLHCLTGCGEVLGMWSAPRSGCSSRSC